MPRLEPRRASRSLSLSIISGRLSPVVYPRGCQAWTHSCSQSEIVAESVWPWPRWLQSSHKCLQDRKLRYAATAATLAAVVAAMVSVAHPRMAHSPELWKRLPKTLEDALGRLRFAGLPVRWCVRVDAQRILSCGMPKYSPPLNGIAVRAGQAPASFSRRGPPDRPFLQSLEGRGKCKKTRLLAQRYSSWCCLLGRSNFCIGENLSQAGKHSETPTARGIPVPLALRLRRRHARRDVTMVYGAP
jgi:hypothetical protein